jgi:beta-galactosidase/arabinogalactan endo-1,4-beta-galactosidase
MEMSFRFIGLSIIAILLSMWTSPFARTQPFIIGADVSYIPQDEAQGAKFFENGVQKDIFQILKDEKFNYIRLRLFYDPTAPSGGSVATTGAVYAGYSSQGYCGLASTLALALRIKAAGMGFSLDFHYSDNWADPGKQYKPHAWANATFTQLTDSVHQYTKYVLTQFKNQGTLPQMVQVGNEITGGMIWPDGSTNNWINLGTLLKAGIAGVKDVDTTIKIVMHIDRGGDNAGTRNWVDNAVKQGVVFDILGESCYTSYQGPPSGWQSNFTDLVTRYPKYSFIMAEYSQDKRAANDIMFNLAGEKGLGTFIWEPLQYGEAIFTRSGSTWNTNAYIDTFINMSKAYGNDTFPTAVAPGAAVSPKIARYAATIVFNNGNSAYIRYAVPGECDIEVTVHSMDGKMVARMSSRATKAGEGIVPWNAIRTIRSGAYLLTLKTDGATKSVSQITICK